MLVCVLMKVALLNEIKADSQASIQDLVIILFLEFFSPQHLQDIPL